MKKIAVFASGNGSNFEALAAACADGRIDARIALLVCDKPGAYVLQRADRFGIPAFVFRPKEYASKADYERQIVERLQAEGVEWIFLAGYMRILSEVMLEAYRDRIVNIHPSLIPSFCGPGMYGMHVHDAVLARGVKVSGATVHFVSQEVDGGPIIKQMACDISDLDKAEDIQARVLEIEHQLLPEVVGLYCDGKIKIIDGKVKVF